MADIVYAQNLDLLQSSQLKGALIGNLASDPAPTASTKYGLVWFNTVSNLLKVWDGTAVQTLTNLLEGVTGTGPIVAGGISGKSQAISITAASGGAAGSMSAAHYSLLAGATNANTASTLVQRDGSGNFLAGTITANLTGTASIAATLAPTANVPLGGFKLTGVGDPTSAQDAATKAYVDANAAGFDIKASARAATTADIAGATYTNTAGSSARGQLTGMPNTLDGVTLAAGNRVLVKNQTTGTAAARGIYVVSTLGSGANGVWDRAADFSTDAMVTSGAFVFIEEGTTNATTQWVLSTANPITIGGASGTSLTFTQFGASITYSAGTGLQLVGSVFSVTTVPVANGGTGVTTAGVAGGIVAGLSTTTMGYSLAGTTGQILVSAGAAVPTWTSTLTIAQGGTNNAGAVVQGAVVWSDASKLTYTAAGTAGQILTSGGTATPAWITTLPIANGGTNSTATATAGGVAYGTGTAYAVTAASTAGYVLTSGGAAAPAFVQFVPVANGGTGVGTVNGGRQNLNAIGKAVISSGTGITPDASTFPVANCAATIGNGALTTFVITYSGPGSSDVEVVVTDTSGNRVFCGEQHTSSTTVTLTFVTAPTTNQYRVVIFG